MKMCLVQQEKANSAKINEDRIRSPWRRLMKQQLKPKLPRTVVNSARINLNRYWSKFEQISNAKGALMTLLPVVNNTETVNPTTPVITGTLRSHQAASLDDNEINDNIFNEIMEIDF